MDLRGVVGNPILKVDDLVWTHEKKPTANRRESEPFGLSESDLLILTFAIQLCCLAHPSSGAFGQILSPPQRLPTDIPLPHFEIIFLDSGLSNRYSLHGSRWGGDRICPNAPDEGTSRWVDSGLDAESGQPQQSKSRDLRDDPTCESEDKKIRFASPEGRIQARVEDPKRRANL